MKALAWYTVVLNLLIIIAFILSLTGVIDTPPFSIAEQTIWALLLVPVVVFALTVARNRD
jgi:hypothetical protein